MSLYEKFPVLSISPHAESCLEGWTEILETLRPRVPVNGRFIVAVELYPGVNPQSLLGKLRDLGTVVSTEDAFRSPEELREIFAETLTDDPVFNVMRPWTIESYFAEEPLARLRAEIEGSAGPVVVLGPGASFVVSQPDLLISVNVSRWELQGLQRTVRTGNLGLGNTGASPGELYKIAYFLDWRVGDECRHRIYKRVSFFVDLNDPEHPRMLPGTDLRAAVHAAVHQPFRVVPFFDPGPWGGQWMRSRFDLPKEPSNYAWGFDCVPEENSVLFGFGDRRFQLPAIVLVQEEPEALLGDEIIRRFGAEFPIRFDLLDTVGGGNLSLQVHPGAEYIRKHFGMPYTQDESYYLLHAEPGSFLYLGLADQEKASSMRTALEEAQAGGEPFPVDRFVARWPTHTHDHFSIPAGTVHCSGAGTVVLEISATPYIFTFKLWDWGRTGLDGNPRPIHLDHGLANICWERDRCWVKDHLIDQTVPVASGEGWTEERTGLHRAEFLETRRHWFTNTVDHNTEGTLNVINLVEGDEMTIRSPAGSFADIVLHYAETIIIPASVGAYTVTPAQHAGPSATIKAMVRPSSSDTGHVDPEL